MFLNKENKPMDKICRIDIAIVDASGNGDTVAASIDFNVAMHVGQEYAECTYEMT